MQFVDSWRLFGPNAQTRGPATLAEVAFDEGEDVAAAVDAWRVELARMAGALGLPVEDAAARVYRGGAVLTFSSALDVLLPATDVNEWAAQSAASVLRGEGPLPVEPQLEILRAAMLARRNPRLLALEAEAHRRGLPLTWDDETVTLGAGRGSRSWPMTALPLSDDVPWGALRSMPIALVTGTNGKTTSARLLARLLKHAGHVVGLTTTDGIWVDERRLEAGDFTGPAGATAVMRDATVDAAVLETARGGILRRGLIVRSPGVALLTNVSEDHLGHYGIDDLAMLARVKAVVGSVVPPSGRVVVNADDPHLMAEAAAFAAPLSLFSLDPASPVLDAHVGAGGEGWTVHAGWIVRREGDRETRLVEVVDVPIAFGGAARYNVANAMGAAASARALGVTDDTLALGLKGFTSSTADNPGRGNLSTVGGVQVLVDFAHNPAGIRSVLALVAELRAGRPRGRLAVVAGYAGDRSDESLRDAARAIFDAAPLRVVLRDLAGYLRGRAPGEVPRLFQEELARLGLPRDVVDVAASEALALRRALDWAEPGDFVLILAHLESAEVAAVLAEG
jgi:cyanophycin synthetase